MQNQKEFYPQINKINRIFFFLFDGLVKSPENADRSLRGATRHGNLPPCEPVGWVALGASACAARTHVKPSLCSLPSQMECWNIGIMVNLCNLRNLRILFVLFAATQRYGRCGTLPLPISAQATPKAGKACPPYVWRVYPPYVWRAGMTETHIWNCYERINT